MGRALPKVHPTTLPCLVGLPVGRGVNWPHSENDAHIAVTAQGLRVEVASGREFVIAAASQLTLPKELGRIRVSVAQMGGGAEWFVRLYGQCLSEIREMNPKGIPPRSPGLRAASYPGKIGWRPPTPTGLWPDGADGAQPRWG